MKKYTKVIAIRRALLKLRQATVPGESMDGQWVQIRYEAARKPSDRALCEAATAHKQGMDMRVFTGHLDKVWRARNGDLCVTVLALERVESSQNPRYCYRTFNTNLGRVRWLKVL